MEETISNIMKNRDDSKGLTRFFIDLALKNLAKPYEIPSLKEAPKIKKDYKKVSFEGIKCCGKDYHINILIKKYPELKLKPKFKNVFPYDFLNKLRAGGVFGGIPDTLLLASAYAFDEEYYIGKGKQTYLQSRGVYTYYTMEVIRLKQETDLDHEVIRDFLFNVIKTIGLPDAGIYFDVDLETAIKRSKIRNKKNPRKQVIEGDFLEEQKVLIKEYEHLFGKLEDKFYRITSTDAEKNVEYIIKLIR